MRLHSEVLLQFIRHRILFLCLFDINTVKLIFYFSESI